MRFGMKREQMMCVDKFLAKYYFWRMICVCSCAFWNSLIAQLLVFDVCVGIVRCGFWYDEFEHHHHVVCAMGGGGGKNWATKWRKEFLLHTSSKPTFCLYVQLCTFWSTLCCSSCTLNRFEFGGLLQEVYSNIHVSNSKRLSFLEAF